MQLIMNDANEKVRLTADVSDEFRQALNAVAITRNKHMGPMLEEILALGEEPDVLAFINELRDTLRKVKAYRQPKKRK